MKSGQKVTQQELADNIGVSFQTISKWETGVNMPDITILPLLADYLKVSTDQLLGLKPLDGEKYIPEKTATIVFNSSMKMLQINQCLFSSSANWNLSYNRAELII